MRAAPGRGRLRSLAARWPAVQGGWMEVGRKVKGPPPPPHPTPPHRTPALPLQRKKPASLWPPTCKRDGPLLPTPACIPIEAPLAPGQPIRGSGRASSRCLVGVGSSSPVQRCRACIRSAQPHKTPKVGCWLLAALATAPPRLAPRQAGSACARGARSPRLRHASAAAMLQHASSAGRTAAITARGPSCGPSWQARAGDRLPGRKRRAVQLSSSPNNRANSGAEM